MYILCVDDLSACFAVHLSPHATCMYYYLADTYHECVYSLCVNANIFFSHQTLVRARFWVNVYMSMLCTQSLQQIGVVSVSDEPHSLGFTWPGDVGFFNSQRAIYTEEGQYVCLKSFNMCVLSFYLRVCPNSMHPTQTQVLCARYHVWKGHVLVGTLTEGPRGLLPKQSAF